LVGRIAVVLAVAESGSPADTPEDQLMSGNVDDGFGDGNVAKAARRIARHQVRRLGRIVVLADLGRLSGSGAQRHMRPLMICAAALACSFATEALADITIQTAKIAKGELTIRGSVSPRTAKAVLTISLGNTVEVEPDRQGRFSWKGAKFPSTCSIEVQAGHETRTFLVADCGMQGPPGPNGQNGIIGVYQVKKICWTGVEAPGQLAPAQPPPLNPPICEISCNPNDFFLSSACGEGDILGPEDHPTGYKCHAFTTTIVCGHK
jgi:hypothetical protein